MRGVRVVIDSSIGAGSAIPLGGQQTRIAYFVSDSTGITAETLGSALLANFPGVRFQRHTIPFVDTVNGARNVVADIERAASVGADPIVFATVKSAEILDELIRSQAVVIDLL